MGSGVGSVSVSTGVVSTGVVSGVSGVSVSVSSEAVSTGVVSTGVVLVGIVSTGVVSTGVVSTGVVSTGVVSTGVVSTGVVSTGVVSHVASVGVVSGVSVVSSVGVQPVAFSPEHSELVVDVIEDSRTSSSFCVVSVVPVSRDIVLGVSDVELDFELDVLPVGVASVSEVVDVSEVELIELEVSVEVSELVAEFGVSEVGVSDVGTEEVTELVVSELEVSKLVAGSELLDTPESVLAILDSQPPVSSHSHSSVVEETDTVSHPPLSSHSHSSVVEDVTDRVSQPPSHSVVEEITDRDRQSSSSSQSHGIGDEEGAGVDGTGAELNSELNEVSIEELRNSVEETEEVRDVSIEVCISDETTEDVSTEISVSEVTSEKVEEETNSEVHPSPVHEELDGKTEDSKRLEEDTTDSLVKVSEDSDEIKRLEKSLDGMELDRLDRLDRLDGIELEETISLVCDTRELDGTELSVSEIKVLVNEAELEV